MKTSLFILILIICSCKTVDSRNLETGANRYDQSELRELSVVEPGVAPVVYFVDGSYIQVSAFSASPKNINISTLLPYPGQGLKISKFQPHSLSQVAAVLFPLQEGDTALKFRQYQDYLREHFAERSSQDKLVVRKEKGLDTISGFIESINQKSLNFRINSVDEPLKIDSTKIDKVYAVILGLGPGAFTSKSETRCYVKTSTSLIKGSEIKREGDTLILSRLGTTGVEIEVAKVLDSGCETPGQVDLTAIRPRVVSIECDGKELLPTSLMYSSCTPLVSKQNKYIQFFPESTLVFDLGKKYRSIDFSYEASIHGTTPLSIIATDVDQSTIVYKKTFLPKTTTTSSPLEGDDRFEFGGSKLEFEILGDSSDSIIMRKPVVREQK